MSIHVIASKFSEILRRPSYILVCCYDKMLVNVAENVIPG